MTIDTEKLRALSRSCEYVVKATEAGDVSELWAVRFDVMGRPYNSRIGVTSHGVAALVAAAVNTLPELLDFVDAASVHRPHDCKHCGAPLDDFCDWRCGRCERETPEDSACPGHCLGDGHLALRRALAAAEARVAKLEGVVECAKASVEINQALGDKAAENMQRLATAEAERLTLARGVERERVRYERGLQLEPQYNAYDLAARIVAEADAASKEVRRG